MPPRPGIQSSRILLLELETRLPRPWEAWLQSRHQVTRAEGTSQALGLAGMDPPDLILVTGDPPEACERAVRLLRPACRLAGISLLVFCPPDAAGLPLQWPVRPDGILAPARSAEELLFALELHLELARWRRVPRGELRLFHPSRESAGEIRALFEPDGALRWCNPAAQQLLGLPGKEGGLHVRDLVGLEDAPLLLERFHSTDLLEGVLRLRHPESGRLIPGYFRSERLPGGRDSREARSLRFKPDAPASQEASGTWSRNPADHRFRRMANSAPVLMWMTTADKMSNWFNQPWLEFVGRTIEQEQGLGWAENIHPEDRDRALAECGAAFQARREFRMEFRLRRRDGAYRWILDHGVPYQDERGEFSGYIGSCIDITELREAQHQLEQANATKDRFLAVLSHELRTPLTPVLFAVEALKQHPGLTSRGGQLLAMIERNIRLEARLIDDLLDLTRIIRNRMEFASEPLDLHECLNAAVEVCRSSMESRGLRLIVRLEASPAAIRGDFQRLEQVFWNLLQNAEKFTPPGGAVEVRTQRDQEKIRIEVSDTGCGIQPEALQNIFAPFEQAGKTSGGLGLGLAICKATVEAHGGSIWAVSDGPGRGARFCVELQTPPASAPR